MKTFYKYLTLIAIISAFFACKDEKVEDPVYIDYTLEVSDMIYYFSYDGGEFTIEVSTDYPQGWSIDTEQTEEWLIVSETTDNTATFIAAENPDEKLRSTSVKIIAGELTRALDFSQINLPVEEEEEVKNVKFEFLPKMYQWAVSTCSRYLGFIESSANGHDVVRFNMATGEKQILYTIREGGEDCYPIVLAENGIMVYQSGAKNEDLVYYLIENGVATPLPVPDNVLYPTVSHISADGKTIVGSVTEGNDNKRNTYPVKWTNKVISKLDFPEAHRDGTPVGSGLAGTTTATADVVSSDGSIIYGKLGSGGDAMMWKNGGNWEWIDPENVEEYEYEVLGGLFTAKGLFCSKEPRTISSNDKWVGLHFTAIGIGVNSAAGTVAHFPAIYNVDSGKVNRFVDFDMINNGKIVFMGDDGTAVYHDNYYPEIRGKTYYVWQNGVTNAAHEWIRQKTGLYITHSVTINCFSENPTIIFGQVTHGGTPFYICVPENQ